VFECFRQAGVTSPYSMSWTRVIPFKNNIMTIDYILQIATMPSLWATCNQRSVFKECLLVSSFAGLSKNTQFPAVTFPSTVCVELEILSKSQVFVYKTQADNVSELMPSLICCAARKHTYSQVVLLKVFED